jgi:hypothetical protein
VPEEARMRTRRGSSAALVALALAVVVALVPLAGAGAATAGPSKDAERIREAVREQIGPLRRYSQGFRNWVKPPIPQGEEGELGPQPLGPSLGTNVDPNDPAQDFGAGQSETAIAASGDRVLAAWNDASAFLLGLHPTSVRASGTGVGYSSDGARTFTDLIGLPNPNPNQQWRGDPTIAAIDDRHFVVGSLYFPSNVVNCKKGPAEATIALSVGTVSADGTSISFGDPVVPLHPGDLCARRWKPSASSIDKEFVSYDPTSRTLAISYTRFFMSGSHSGLGQIEVVRAAVPSDPASLSPADFSPKVVVWQEEAWANWNDPVTPADQVMAVNQGAYPAVAPNGDVFVAWERNIDTNLYFGLDPYVYLHVARVPAGASAPDLGGRDDPVVFTKGQVNSSSDGGVKSMNTVVIAGFNRGLGQDFPRIAVDPVGQRVVLVWNDGSLHPLGDIWMRTATFDLTMGPIRRVNDDDSYALHFMPAVSVGSDGSIRTSWYDRRLWGGDSPDTDYFGEIRANALTNAPDFRISTGESDWTNTSTLIIPNFGDYTDNATSGTTTYFTWSDGRLGVPQPMVDSAP